MMNDLSINTTVAARIDSFIQAAGISPASKRWLLHLTPTEGDMAHTTTTLLLQWPGTTDPRDVQWQDRFITHHPVAFTRAEAEVLAPVITSSPHIAS